MSTKEKLKLVEAAFNRLAFLDNISWTNYRDRLFELCHEEEKQHRSGTFRENHTADTMSASVAARVMAVKRVAEYLSGHRMPRGKDFLHYQKSCFQAAGLVDGYRKEIRKAWRGLDVAALASLDYCEFVKAKS